MLFRQFKQKPLQSVTWHARTYGRQIWTEHEREDLTATATSALHKTIIWLNEIYHMSHDNIFYHTFIVFFFCQRVYPVIWWKRAAGTYFSPQKSDMSGEYTTTEPEFFLNKLILEERNNLLLIYFTIVHFLTTHLLWFDRFAPINSVGNCLESECYVSLSSACVSHSSSFLATKQLTTNMSVLTFFMHCF